MARIIEFQIPENYRPQTQVIIAITRGEMIEFPRHIPKKRTADRKRADWS